MVSEATTLSDVNFPKRAYTVAAIGVMAATVLSIVLMAGQGRGLYMTSGVWAGLAVDLADGTFYRPVHAEDGFGGTRYMPLQFVLHAAVLSIINHPALAAHIVVFAAAIGLIGGLYRFLRAYDLPPPIAAACALMAMSAVTIQYGLVSTRGDLLAAALNVWGIAFCAACTSKDSKRAIVFASMFFALAFMTKFTTVFGVAAVVVFFAMNGRWRYAIGTGALTAAFAAGMLGAVHFASEGRALDSFLACAAGGTSVWDLILSPFKFLYAARLDISFLIFFACACVVIVLRRRGLRDLPSTWFLFSGIMTITIMSSPGTDLSHFIDLQVASVALTAVHMNQAPRPRALAAVLPSAGLLGAALLIVFAIGTSLFLKESRWQQQDRIMAIVGEGEAPMLADDPWVPILADERPFVLDTFAIRTASEQQPKIAEDLFAKLDEHFFRAVVLYIPKLLRDEETAINGTWRGKRWYGELFYPPGFEERLLNAYKPEAFIGEYIVLLPK